MTFDVLNFLSATGLNFLRKVGKRRSSPRMNLGLRLGDVKGAAGSAFVELGQTKIFAAVYGPIEPDSQQDAGIIECQISHIFDQSSSLEGLQHKLLHTFSAAIRRESYFKALIRVCLSVVDQGRSLADAATLAGSMALINAGIELTDFIVSCTVAVVNGTFLKFGESETLIRVALMASRDEIIETEVVGKVDAVTITNAVDAACYGCKELKQAIRKFFAEQT
jgi:ribonuclease PH